ncbi:MAG: hypothetical protein AB7J40_05515 [Candidatus Altimarinota bacterium]
MAGLLSAAVFFSTMVHLPNVLEWLASYRSDWSLIYLVQTVGLKEILTELVFYHLFYGALAAGVVIVLLIYALITFQWRRFLTIGTRVYRQSGCIVFFSVLTCVFQRVWEILFEVRMEAMVSMLELFGFLLVFQLLIRLLDSARLESPRLFLEYFYSLGLGFLFLRFFFLLPGWIMRPAQIHGIFFEQVFVFFFVLLLIGLLLSFALRAYFISPFFHARFRSWYGMFVKRDVLTEKERFVPYQLIQGLLLSSVVGFLFLLSIFQGWILPLVLFFFAGYFLLFYLLDHLEDMKTKGDLVPQRVHSVHNRSFVKS